MTDEFIATIVALFVVACFGLLVLTDSAEEDPYTKASIQCVEAGGTWNDVKKICVSK